jgi:hypothetical protein
MEIPLCQHCSTDQTGRVGMKTVPGPQGYVSWICPECGHLDTIQGDAQGAPETTVEAEFRDWVEDVHLMGDGSRDR